MYIRTNTFVYSLYKLRLCSSYGEKQSKIVYSENNMEILNGIKNSIEI